MLNLSTCSACKSTFSSRLANALHMGQSVVLVYDVILLQKLSRSALVTCLDRKLPWKYSCFGNVLLRIQDVNVLTIKVSKLLREVENNE